jgi:hypothetical protein
MIPAGQSATGEAASYTIFMPSTFFQPVMMYLGQVMKTGSFPNAWNVIG